MKLSIKKLLITTIASVLAINLAACGKVQLRTIETSELSADAKKAVKTDYGQFLPTDNCQISDIDKLYSVTFSTYTDFSNRYEEVFKKIGKIDTLSGDKLTGDKDYMGNGYIYDDSDQKLYMSISDSGFFSYYSNDIYQLDYDSVKIKDIYVNGSDDWYGDNSNFEFNGNDYTVQKAAETGKAWLEDNWKSYEPDFDYEPQHILLCEYNGKQMLSVNFNKYYNGVVLSQYDRIAEEDGEADAFEQTRNTGLTVYITGNGEVSAFTTGGSALKVGDDKTELHECMPLSNAFEFAEEKITKYKNLNVVSANLKYVLKYPEKVNKDTDTWEVGVDNSTELVWELKILPKYPDFSKADGLIPSYKYVNVDAIKGGVSDSYFQYKESFEIGI